MIGLIIFATSKYITLLPELYNSWRKYFFVNDERKIYLFTDQIFIADGIEKIAIEHEAWPNITLKRFHRINQFKHFLNADYLFWLDADMIINDYIDKEILGDLVGTLHQGYIGKKGTPEINPKSTACINNEKYYTGSFWGGKRDRVLELSEQLQKNIDIDYKNNITAIWHDESHLNWYFENYKPDKILGPEYNWWYKNPRELNKISVREKNNKEFQI